MKVIPKGKHVQQPPELSEIGRIEEYVLYKSFVENDHYVYYDGLHYHETEITCGEGIPEAEKAAKFCAFVHKIRAIYGTGTDPVT